MLGPIVRSCSRRQTLEAGSASHNQGLTSARRVAKNKCAIVVDSGRNGTCRIMLRCALTALWSHSVVRHDSFAQPVRTFLDAGRARVSYTVPNLLSLFLAPRLARRGLSTTAATPPWSSAAPRESARLDHRAGWLALGPRSGISAGLEWSTCANPSTHSKEGAQQYERCRHDELH